jgi:Na+-driven multidrug efflux pump
MTAALRFILPGILVYGLAQSFSGFYTYQRGWPWASAVVAGTGLALDMVLAVLLVPAMGVNGAALASALAYSGAMVGALALFLRAERLGPAQVFRFGRRELDDYRAFLAHLSSALQRRSANTPRQPTADN